jgi:hypothetical protein
MHIQLRKEEHTPVRAIHAGSLVLNLKENNEDIVF